VSVTLGGQTRSTPGRRGQTHRQLDAGEASCGGEPRVFVSGDQTAGRGHLCDADARPHRVVVAVGPRVAGVIAGDDLGGRRSPSELGVDATVAGEARARHLRTLHSTGRELSMTARPLGGRRHVGGGHRRRRVSVIGKTATRTSKRRGDKGETV